MAEQQPDPASTNHLSRENDGSAVSSATATRWSLVVAAANRHCPGGDEALAVLCQLYWLPLFTFVRRRCATMEEAEDLTQEFFARLLAGNYLADATPTRGRFRAFLYTALDHFLSNERDR